MPTATATYLYSLSEQCGSERYDATTGFCLIPRDTLWYGIALLFSPDESARARGAEILGRIRNEDSTHTPATMLAALHGIPDALPAAAAEHFRAEVLASLVSAASVEWNDGNVNHPLGAWCTLILGGELCGEHWAVILGRRKLSRLRAVTGDRRSGALRQSELSEYHSLTYTALDLCFLALIAEYARDGEARALARFLEEGLWLAVAARYHAPSMQFAGPHSRSYQDDSTGGCSALHFAWLAATGSRIFIRPDLATFYDHPSTLLQNALVALIPFHFPNAARVLAEQMNYPYLLRTTTYGESYHENRAGGGFDSEIYPGGWSDLTTYMTGEYALGSASTPYVNAGHADALMLRIRRAESVASMEDFRSLYTRGVFNGAVPGRSNHCHVTGGTVDASYVYEEGRSAVYQHRDRAIVLYAPKRAGHSGITSFDLAVIAGYDAPFDALAVDGEPVREFPAVFSSARSIAFRDYRTYGLLLPIPREPDAAGDAVRIERHGAHLVISLCNYHGEPLTVERDELTRWKNGFALHLATAETEGSFENFLTRSARWIVTENADARGVRDVRYRTEDGEMRAVYDPFRERFLSRTFNGEEEAVRHFEIECPDGPASRELAGSFFGKEAFEAFRRRQTEPDT